MTHSLIPLPFGKKALEPGLSDETLEYHHGKHHAGYVAKLNTLIKSTSYEAMPLEEIIRLAEGAIFNNAAQVYNHNVYFEGMTNKKTTPSKTLHNLIEHTFGSMEHFKELFLDAALNLFGSGWVWLCKSKDGELLIKSYSNAANPLLNNLKPLMTCDVWEHAYYIDYRNARADYLKAWWELINWEYVSKKFED